MRWAAVVCLMGSVWAGSPPVALFDGKSLNGWRAPVGAVPTDCCWRVDDGAIHPVGDNPIVDLWSANTYGNFTLDFEFQVAPNANGGIKYLVQGGGAFRVRGHKFLPAETTEAQPGDVYIEGTGGLEFQIVDDAEPEAKDPKRRAGSMYSLVAPLDPPPIGPGRWHTGRIVVDGSRIQHFLDGRRVVDVRLGSPEMEASWDACKRGDIKRMRAMTKRETPIVITHHGTLVRYRNIRIEPLP